MDPITRAQKLLLKTKCSSCQSEKLSFRLVCDNKQVCVKQAHCESCGAKFELQTAAQVYDINNEIVNNLVCPQCGANKASHKYHCDIKTHECDEAITCDSCSYVFGKLGVA